MVDDIPRSSPAGPARPPHLARRKDAVARPNAARRRRGLRGGAGGARGAVRGAVHDPGPTPLPPHRRPLRRRGARPLPSPLHVMPGAATRTAGGPGAERRGAPSPGPAHRNPIGIRGARPSRAIWGAGEPEGRSGGLAARRAPPAPSASTASNAGTRPGGAWVARGQRGDWTRRRSSFLSARFFLPSFGGPSAVLGPLCTTDTASPGRKRCGRC